MEVLRGVHLIRGEVSNTYLVKAESCYVLVDAGSPGDVDAIITYIESLGLGLRDVAFVLVTHAHWDHVGGLNRIKELTGARAAAHRVEAPRVEAGGQRYSGTKVEVLLEDGDLIAGLRAVHAPGHTPGNTCFLDESREALFAGDLMYEEGGKLHEMDSRYSVDPEGNRKSIMRLLNYGFRHVLPSHGNPVIGSGREAVKELAEELKFRI